MKITPQLIKIDLKIKEYIKNGGKLTDPNLPFDKDIKAYVSNMNRRKKKLLETDPTNPECLEVYTKDEILKTLGYEPPVKHKEITMVRIQTEIAEYFNNGGKVENNCKNYPFYITIKKFIERENKKGYNYTYDGIMSLSGRYTRKLQADRDILRKYADGDGCIDSIRGTKDYDHIRIRAQVLGLAPAEYVAAISSYTFSKSIITVENYIANLKQEISDALDGKTDATGLRETHPELYLKVRHLREYFPEGSLDSIGDTFNYMGFAYEGRELPKNKVPVEYYLKKLEAMFPDKVVTKIDHKSVMGKCLLRASLENNMFLNDFLAQNGFTYVASKNSKRLTQTNSNKTVKRLNEIYEEEAVRYNLEHSPLNTKIVARKTLSGRVLPSQAVVDEPVIYMPSAYEMEQSELAVLERAKARYEQEKNGKSK